MADCRIRHAAGYARGRVLYASVYEASYVIDSLDSNGAVGVQIGPSAVSEPSADAV